MKYTKKHAGLLAAVLAVLLLSVSACGPSKGGDSPDASSPETVQSDNSSEASDAADSGDSSEASSAADSGDSSGTADNSGDDQTDSAVTVTDMTGREITLDEPATRVVALTPADCEILFAIGAGDALVGRGEYCDYPAEVADVPAVNSGSETNIEQILALEPQVLLMATMAQTEEQVQQLEDAGVHVVVSDAQDIAGTYDAIEMIGALMGRDDAAASLVEEMKDSFADLSSKATGDGSKSIYFEVSPLEYGLWTAGANTFMDEVADMLGVANCFDDVDGWGSISEEQVLERDPDYIMTITMYYGEGPTPDEEIVSRPGWENVTAVKNGMILNLPNNELSRPGPRLVDGAQALYDFIYGNAD